MPKYNTDFYEPTSAQTLSSIASKACALTIGYFVKTIPDPDFVPRLELALNALLFAAGHNSDSNAEKSGAGAIIEELLSDEKKIKIRQDAEGFDSASQFGTYVSLTQSKLSSDAGVEPKIDAVVACVALGLAIRAQDLRSGYDIYALFSRLLIYLAHAHGKNFMMTYGNMESLTQLDLTAVSKELNANVEEGKGEEVMMTSFGFEDLTSIFIGEKDNHVVLDAMKDSELQSYKFEAELVYSDVTWKDNVFCEEISVPVTNAYGKTTGYKNIGPISYPCIDESYNITPITGTILSRTTVEVPPVSGVYSNEYPCSEYGHDTKSTCEGANGTWTPTNVSFIEERLRANYPAGAFYGDTYDYNNAEEYKHADGTWLTSYYGHAVSNASHYESYDYVNDHETTAGIPWANGYRYGTCYDNAGVYIYGYGGVAYYAQKDCDYAPNQCADHTATGDTASAICAQFNGWWTIFPTDSFAKCGFSSSSDCSNADGNWSGNSWVFGDFYEIPAPPAFPGGEVPYVYSSFAPQRDMSLRHHIIKEGQGSAIPWWQDQSIIERTGFAIAPLEFSLERLSGLYKDYKVNPIINFTNVGRRAFAADAPTVGVVPHTVGPPQPGFGLFLDPQKKDWEGGPFAHAQVVSQNKTLKQIASISITPGWMWKFEHGQPSSQKTVYHTMETGGWSIPLSQIYYHGGFSDPTEAKMDISFESNKISNFYDKDYITGDEAHPLIYHTDASIRSEEGHHNQDLTINRFFGMGDNSQDYTIVPWTRLNAGFQWTFYTVLTGTIPTGLLHSYVDSYSTTTFADALLSRGAEWLYESTTLGISGPDYWNEFITGYINTGEDHAGKVVSCMHEYTGFSTTTNNTVKYWWVDPNLPSSPPFPHEGFENGHYDSRHLAPTPNISRCREHFPYTTTTTAEPTTTTTNTTTTCDPMDPECYEGGSSTSTSTTEDPLFGDCDSPIKVQCPYDCDAGEEGEWIEFCNYEQCSFAMCGGEPWDNGIYPEEWDWAPMFGKQRGENPPRYWRGPYASTHYRFMYPNASGAFDQFYESELTDPDFKSLITGFPTKIKFDVHVEEYISKDICSGGYVDSDGSIVLNEIVRNEEGSLQPSHQETTKDVPWAHLVDANFSPESELADFDYDYSSYAIIHDLEQKRNNSFYDKIPTFCAGNKIGTASGIKYLPSEDVSSHLAFGGYYRHTGYDFKIEATYAKPSFSLETYSSDFSSIINALSVGNEFAYDCGFFNDGQDNSLATLDPVHFLKMVSDNGLTGSFVENFLNNITGDSYVTGHLLHPHRVYGDHWMGLRSGCLFHITGNYDWQGTGYEPLNPECPHMELENNLEMEACTYAAEELGITSLNSYAEFADDKVFLFNVGDNEIDIHFRRPVYLDGWEMSDGMGVGDMDGLGTLGFDGCSAASKANVISITGLAPLSVNCSDGVSASEDLCCTNNGGSWAGGNCQGGTAVWADDGSAAPPFKGLNLFKQDSAEDITITKEIIRNEGLLFELPTKEWSCSGNYYETITEHGARIAQGVRPTGCTNSNPWTSTSTTAAGFVTTTEEFLPTEYLRVSGWREISQLKITLKNIQPYVNEADELPSDSWFIFQQSGSCSVTGYMAYQKQEEACIYTEGIVLEDRSDDPWFHLIDYPHYASDVLKRESFVLPSGDLTEHPLLSAPSRMMTRWRVDRIEGNSETGNHMINIKSQSPENYNKYLWPTISDLHYYNGDALSWESIPREDGHTYLNTQLLVSADAGQPVDVGVVANKVFKRYVITQHWGIYDSMIVDPLINPQFKIKLTKEKGGGIGETVEPKGGYIVPEGTTCWDIKQGLVSGSKQGEEGYVEDNE